MGRLKIAECTYPNVRKGMYLITNQGTVINAISMRPQSIYIDKDGYFRTSLTPDDRRQSRNFQIHRLVAWQFCENLAPEIKTQVNHIDGIKTHNFDWNLEWVTPGENTRHAIANHLRNTSGENGTHSIYSKSMVEDICEKYQIGMQPIEVYRLYYPDGPIRDSDQVSLYRLLWNLKKRKVWGEITSKYSYSTDIVKNPAAKVFMPTDRYPYTTDDIKWICELLEF